MDILLEVDIIILMQLHLLVCDMIVTDPPKSELNMCLFIRTLALTVLP